MNNMLNWVLPISVVISVGLAYAVLEYCKRQMEADERRRQKDSEILPPIPVDNFLRSPPTQPDKSE